LWRLALPVRLQQSLIEVGLATIEDLEKATDEQLQGAHNIGPKRAAMIRERLRQWKQKPRRVWSKASHSGL
jgi:ERCC4-type nuclease